jgi:hypothetical protein
MSSADAAQLEKEARLQNARKKVELAARFCFV